jgi:5'-3' exonuclease
MFFKVLHANFQLIENAFNRMPKTKVVRLNKLEADFVPYYLLSRNVVEYSSDRAHVVYSNDHDMWQCVSDHSFIFSKSGKSKKIVEKGDTMKLMLKKPNKIPDIFLPLAMAIIGDPGDDVEGVKGIGPARFLTLFPDLVELTGNMGEIYEKVRKGKNIFEPVPSHFKNKYMRDVVQAEIDHKQISNNLKLVSFELISREVDDPSSLEMNNRREQILETINATKTTPIESMKKALDMSGILLEESSIDFLYI